MAATLQLALTTKVIVSLATRELHMLEVMKGKEKVQTGNRKRRRKDDRNLRDLLRTREAVVILRSGHREKILPRQKIFTIESAQVETSGVGSIGRSSLGNVEAEERGVRAGKRSLRSGE